MNQVDAIKQGVETLNAIYAEGYAPADGAQNLATVMLAQAIDRQTELLRPVVDKLMTLAPALDYLMVEFTAELAAKTGHK